MSEPTQGTYKGDTFRNLIRNYSKQRMQRDPKYRHGVEKILEQRRKTAKKAEVK